MWGVQGGRYSCLGTGEERGAGGASHASGQGGGISTHEGQACGLWIPFHTGRERTADRGHRCLPYEGGAHDFHTGSAPSIGCKR